MKNYTSYFLGIPLPQEYLKEFEQLLNNIHSIDPSIKTVNPQTPHITTYYLNKKFQNSLEETNAKIQPLNKILNNLTLTIGGFNYFTKDDPKILFLDVKHPDALIEYKNKISQVLGKYSAPDNNLPFHPHLTLGKIKNLQGQQSSNKTKNEIIPKLNKIKWEFKINEIILYGADSTKSPEQQEKLLTIPIN